MAVSVKMGVDLTTFKTGMQQAQQAVKTTSAQLKAAAAEFKATGDKEKYMAQQSKLLKTQLTEQQKAVKNAEDAMKAMRNAGVDETSASFQKLAQQLASAQAAMYQTEAALNSLSADEQQAASGANELADNLKSINKKVSFDAVIGGIDKITGALGSALKKAVSLGESIFNSLMDSARWADDVQTAASMYGISVDEYLRLEAMVATGMDTSVDAILGAQARLRKGIGKESADAIGYLKQFGLVVTEYGGKTEEGFNKLVTDDQMELFFKAGKGIMEMKDAYEQEAAAQAIFGKSWRELVPLFNEYSSYEEYSQAMAEMNVNTDDQVNKLAELSDAMDKLEHDFKVLKNDILAELAPVLTEVAHALSDVVKSISDYLKTDEGQEQLKRFSDAIAGIVEDITNIDPESVVSTFATIVEGIVGAFQWISDHWSEVKTALIGIGAGFLALKTASLGLTVGKLVSGFSSLLGGGAAAAGGAGAAGAGAAGSAGAAASGTAAAGGGFLAKTATVAKAALSSTAGTTMIGGAIAVAAPLLIHELLKAEDYLYNDTYEEGRFDSRETRMLNELVTRMSFFNQNENAQGIADAMTLFMAQTLSSEDLFRQFRMSDGNNLLMDMLGGGYSYSGTLYDMIAKRFGSTDYRDWGLSEDMLEKYGEAMFNGWNQQVDQERSGTLYNSEAMAALALGLQGHFGQYTGEIDAQLSEESIQEMQDELNRADAKLPVKIVPNLGGYGSVYGSGVLETITGMWFNHANGLFSVPWDGYPAILHKGERVLTASQANNYNSNIYFGNVNLNNGLEIEALTESIDRRNRRQRSGYGS